MMSTKDQVKREADAAGQKLSEASEEVKSRAREAAASAQGVATGYAEEGKRAAASHLNDFARAVRSASNELAQRDQGVAARFVTEAADGLEKMADSVSGTSMDEVMDSVQTFARRNPAAFVVGSVLAGVALGRFVKASSERSHGRTPSGGGGATGASTGSPTSGGGVSSGASTSYGAPHPTPTSPPASTTGVRPSNPTAS